MDNKKIKNLDGAVRDIQLKVLEIRCQDLPPIPPKQDKLYAYINSISAINQNCNTKYLTYELCRMKLTDSNGKMQNFTLYLPFREGDEHVFESK